MTVVEFPNVVAIAASRSAGVVALARLVDILNGAAPEGSERFCFDVVLAQSTLVERVELASRAGLSWKKFARRFQALTGIHRDRAHFATNP